MRTLARLVKPVRTRQSCPVSATGHSGRRCPDVDRKGRSQSPASPADNVARMLLSHGDRRDCADAGLALAGVRDKALAIVAVSCINKTPDRGKRT